MAGCNHGNITVGKPRWLRRSLPTGPEYEKMRQLLKRSHLTTVCQEAQCPNQFECYSEGTATFMILGDRCTRNCHFCAVEHKPLTLPDPEEPERVAEAVDILKLRYAVITSVTRDDLSDGGASLFAETIRAVRKRRPETLIEVLIPDLQGNWQALAAIVDAAPDVLNHNMETVPSLYPRVRPEAIYERSLALLSEGKKLNPQLPTKSGIMVGLGETRDELVRVWDDLLTAGCDILTLGQYLQPSKNHLPVERFVEPEEFAQLQDEALARGFAGVAAGPFVRSSYQAESLYRKVRRQLAG
ncbi:lipoyl synthase [Desulfopila aestuarii]|uniref:Lipoyl synthase n=1 Tax=Desulfopila aestuarii DSM 18488 TaxID=1121416 RepID=A0A1M7Y8P9_9BACT|nr:lipoyl synthase [Desulfopila aestuarii]SHO49000.1 lipoic acid synthetase [Desulfopila aestuarii DSM 18488]